MTMGSKIKKYLFDNGITQRFVCQKTGIPSNTFSTMLNNKRKITVEEYALICNALGLSLEYLFEKDKTA